MHHSIHPHPLCCTSYMLTPHVCIIAFSPTQRSFHSKKEQKHGVSGQAELQEIIVAYLSVELKLRREDATSLLAPVVLETDLSYPKTPLMHALDFGATELAQAIKTEIAKATKKKQHVTSNDESAEGGGFDRSGLAKQRLMASRGGNTKGKKQVTARPIMTSSGMELTEEEKCQMAKFSGMSLPPPSG